MERGVIVWVGVCHGLCLSARYRAVGNAPSGLRLALDELTLRACSNASSAAEGGLLRARANRVMALVFGEFAFLPFSLGPAGVVVYYCRTYEKAVSEGGEREKGGHVLRDTTSRGLYVQGC